MIDELIGWIGGGLFLLSWIIQNWETKRNKKVTMSATFFWLRVVGSIMMAVEAFRVFSPSLIMINLSTAAFQGYNIMVIRRKSEQPIPLSCSSRRAQW